MGAKGLVREEFLIEGARLPRCRFSLAGSRPKISVQMWEGDDEDPMPPVGQLCLFGLTPAAFTGKVFTNATASSSHALSASFVGIGGSI
jgi:hypothetical protein